MQSSARSSAETPNMPRSSLPTEARFRISTTAMLRQRNISSVSACLSGGEAETALMSPLRFSDFPAGGYTAGLGRTPRGLERNRPNAAGAVRDEKREHHSDPHSETGNATAAM